MRRMYLSDWVKDGTAGGEREKEKKICILSDNSMLPANTN
jgi:hypothetical protein